MVGFFLKLAAIAAAAVMLASPALAQDEAYLEEFRAYQAALNNGDTKSALAHGYAAWQAAEAQLGDDRLTAILAYNYGQLAIYSDPAKANAALSRAKELASEGFAELPQTYLDLYLAYTAFKFDEDRRGEANILRKRLEALDGDGSPPKRDMANMWFELASTDIRRKRYREARNSAERAEVLIAEVFPENFRSQATAAIFHGVSWLAPMPRTEKNTLRAIHSFVRAGGMFPPQENIETFDPLLAQAFGWQSVGHAVYLSNGFSKENLPDSISEAGLFGGDYKTFEECGVSWDTREPPRYPRKELQRGYLGGVVIGYHLGDDVYVHEPRILAEVPGGAFSDAVLEAVADWKLTTPLQDDPRCRKNRITWFTFIIDG